MTLRSDQLDYELPPERIAKEPVHPRDQSRLLVLDRARGEITHRRFADLCDFLNPGDCLVLNTTRVRKARLLGKRRTGGSVEALLLRPNPEGTWEALCRPAARLRVGDILKFDGKATAEVIALGEEGRRTIRVDSPVPFEEYLERYGHVPLPPYINRPDTPRDAETYQTVYAEQPGAVAAPTAGLHFTETLLASLAAKGIERADIVLHVGPGTFRPLTTETVEAHRLDPEWYTVPPETRTGIEATRARGGRIVAVGTTSVRVLETIAGAAHNGRSIEGWAELLISPPYEFRLVDAMITNFHLPRTSLLALVVAFAGLEQTLNAYQVAIAERYRFYSYGDAMMIL